MIHLHALVKSRDGIRLATDIYLPGKSASFPTIVQRTPYGKLGEQFVSYAEWVAEHGYACAIQDVRGRHDSDGTWHPYDNHEDTDGFDTIEWVTKQRWSNGRVAFTGSSYGAFAGFMAALTRHPALKALVARVPASGLYHRHFYYGGIFSLGRLAWGTLVNGRVLQGTWSQGQELPIFNRLIKEAPEIFLHLPVEEIGELFPMPIPWWRLWVQHETEDAYWHRLEILHHLDRVQIPVYHISGWHDDFCSVALENFQAFSRVQPPGQKGHHRLLMGMWPHHLNIRGDHGGIDYGPEAVIPLWDREIHWLDQWLADKRKEVSEEPPVRLFIMGENRWHTYHHWPPEKAECVPLYLREGGRLSFDAPKGEKADAFLYNPQSPTPQPWNFGEPEMPDVPGWSIDASPRDDRLIYSSPPLNEPLTVVGPVILRLFGESSARDTDWFAWVGWEDPETGGIRLLTYGYAIRARFRHGFTTPALLTPGEIFEYAIDLGATARLLPRRSRLFCCIQSSCAPWFSRNLNTGGENYREDASISAHQKVYHDTEHPSRLILWAVKRSTRNE